MSIEVPQANDVNSPVIAEVSFRPAFLTKKPAAPSQDASPSAVPFNPLVSAPITPPRGGLYAPVLYQNQFKSSSHEESSSSQQLYAVFRERPTDEAARIYTKDFFLKCRPPPSVRPPKETADRIIQAELWVEDYEAARSPSKRPSSSRDDKDKDDSAAKDSQTRSDDSNARRPVRSRNPREMFRSQVQTSLNKLTVDNFKKISEQLLAALKDAKTIDLLDEAVSIFHKKVLSDAKFTTMYVDLMRIINKDLEPLKDSTNGKPVSFRGLTLNKCQEVFETSLDPPIPTAASDADEVARQVKLGVVNVLFLAELARAGLLPPKVFVNCLETLLAKIKTQLESKSPGSAYQAEVNSEKLSKALVLSGETIAAKEQFRFQLMQIAYEVEQLAKWPGLSSRHLYFLQDVIDASQNNWVRRRVIEGPQSIIDLHTKAFLSSDPLMSATANKSSPAKTPTSSTHLASGSSGTKRTVVRRIVHEDSTKK